MAEISEMKPAYFIFKNVALALMCMITWTCPLRGFAQDDDSVLFYLDTVAVSRENNNIQNEVRQKGSSDEMVYRSVPDTTVARMKGEKAFAYANDPAYWIKQHKVSGKGFLDYVIDFFESTLVRIIFYMLVAGLVIFVLYRVVVVNELFIFYSAKKSKKNFKESETTVLDPGTLNRKIQESIDQKKLNTAIRYLYLKTLYTLNEKSLIKFHPQASNNDYMDQMSDHKQVKDFRFLTEVYEYVWYGQFQISEQQFLIVHNSFNDFHSGI